MKKPNYLELFLFIVCTIFVIVGIFNFGGLLNSIADLLIPQDNQFNDKYYTYRQLIQQIPMLIVSVLTVMFSFKKALAIRKEDKELKEKKE